MARKAVTQGSQRRAGVNRAQLKAHAARQAMTASAAAPRPVTEVAETGVASPARPDYTGIVPRAQRRATLSRAQEFAYIRRDLIRLTVISALLLALLLVLLVVLR
ncbi:MAG: hypothetical protein M3Q65_15995 [Chloroflexota bacterium]|nr:hypothetical protein [Chloroflexota bacterium]